VKNKVLIFINLLFIINCFSKNEVNIFENINILENFYNANPESPDYDNKNPFKPDYSSYYNKQTPTKIENITNKLLSYIGMEKIYWNETKFKSLLKKVIKLQEIQNPNKTHIVKITPEKTTNFIVFTEVQGAFHSLIRNLNELIKLKIIDKNLKINPDHFIIFNGNILGRSPYLLETFTIILKLIEKNPKNVFFIKGEYEIKENWKNFGLKKELQKKLTRKSLKTIPLEKELNDFLKLQPLAIYINDLISQDPGFIRISYFDRSYKDLNEIYYSHFLQNKPQNTIEYFELKDNIMTNKQIKIKSIIKGEKKITSYKKTDGLTSVLPDKGASAWISFSSPTKPNQNLYQFINDAFVILTIQNETDPKLTLLKQNSLNPAGFIKIAYNAYTQNEYDKKDSPDMKSKPKEVVAQKEILSTEVDTQKEILLGTTMDLSGELSETSRQVLSGLYLRINQENEKGGINGKQIKLTYLDDRYNTRIARENIQTLMNAGIKTLLTPVGSLTLKSILPIIQKENLAVIFPEATTPEFRNKDIKNIVHLFASSDQEGKVLIEYLLKQYAPSKIALFYRPEPFSLGALEAIKKVLKEKNLIEKKDWIATYHLPNSLDLSQPVKEIKKFNPEAIVLLSTSLVVQNLVKELGLEFLFNKQISAISSCSGTAFKTFLRGNSLKFINTQLIPDPVQSQLQIVEKFRQAAKISGDPLGGFILEGYMSADIFINLLNKINGTITAEKILQITENIKNYDYSGLKLNFNPQTREIANYLWLDDDGQVTMHTY
jgi:branched-chain amino acid transport system substrate-binding protein